MSVGGLRRLAVAATLLVPLAAQALPEQTWLVAIGNNDGAAMDISLLYAQRDAQALAEVLRELGHVSSRRTTLLLDEDAETVRRTLQDVNSAIRNRAARNEPTALIVYYSGHADAASLHLRGTELALDDLKALIDGSPAGMRLLIVDACRSGTVTRVKGVKAAEPFSIEMHDEVVPEGVAIVTSSAAGESSQESDQLRGSFFTHHLVNALRGAADKNEDGQVTLAEAYTYAYTETLRSSGQTMALQHPTYAWSVKGRDQLVLTVPAQAQARMGRLRLRTGASYLIMERKEGGPIVAEVSPQSDRTVIVLQAGDYFVQRREATEYREYQVHLPVGGEVDLEGAPYRSIRYDRLVRRRGGPVSFVQSFSLLAGAHGGILAGESTVPETQLGYGLDFDWGSVGLRLRGATVTGDGGDDMLPQRHTEIGGGVILQKFIDFPMFSLAFGVEAEGVHHEQTFDTARIVSDISSWGGVFSGVFAAETHLGHGFMLRLEGGPATNVIKEATTTAGIATGDEIASPFTWWACGGLVWRR